MFEFLSPLTFLLLGNSIVTIGLILNQNESSKDSMNTQNSNSSPNPLETITWICLVFQIIILLFKIKLTEL
jgi:preprotein translocase subunit SecG